VLILGQGPAGERENIETRPTGQDDFIDSIKLQRMANKHNSGCFNQLAATVESNASVKVSSCNSERPNAALPPQAGNHNTERPRISQRLCAADGREKWTEK
jgi:hypothetical protein